MASDGVGSAHPAEPSALRMRGARLELPAGARIAALRALALGDLLCAVPAFRSLRAAHPDAEITLIGLPWAREFVGRFGRYIDRFVEFPGFPGIPERPLDPAALTDFLRAAQADPYDLAIQLQGNGMHSNGFVALLGARRTAGYFLPAAGCPDAGLFVEYEGHGPEVRRHLGLMASLGCPDTGEELEFPITAGDEGEAARLRAEHGLADQAYVCIHPGASVPARRWDPSRFAAIADCVAAQGPRVVLTGTSAEAPIVDAVKVAMRAPAVNLAGATSLGGVAALLRDARLLVSNDTSVAHIADALRVPSVIVFLDSERERWAAIDTALHAGVGTGSTVNCRSHAGGEHRCLRDACVAARPASDEDVTVEQVWAGVERQLQARPVLASGESIGAA